jgi:hypothetical protein
MVVNRFGLLILCIGWIVVCLAISGCVTDAAPVAVKPTATAIPEPVMVQINESQPLVKTEVLELVESESEWMYRNHGKYLNETFSVDRKNVTGDKDLLLNIAVYDYRFMKSYHESGAADWGTNYWWPHVAPAGKKFLFVFLREEMEGTNQTNDPRMWGFSGRSFRVQVGNDIFGQDPDHIPCLPIKELEHVGNFNDDTLVSDFGKLRVESLTNPTGKSSVESIVKIKSCGGQESTYTNIQSLPSGDGGSQCLDLGWLRMGISNQWDGYLIYVIPESAKLEDIKILGDFSGFGNAWWKLTPEEKS